MADEGAPLLRLASPKTLTRKKRAPSFPPPPERQPAEHAGFLRQGLEDIRRHFRDAVSRLPALATDVPYVRIEMAPGVLVTDAELSSIGLVPVYRRGGAILAAYSSDRDLRQFQTQLASYSQLKKKLAVLSKIESVKSWSRDDRMSKRLKAVTIDASTRYTVDLLLMPIKDEEPNPQAVRSIEQFVTVSQGAVVDRALEPTFAALRVRLGGQALDQLLDYRDDVAFADLPPVAHILVPEALSLRIDDLPEVKAPPATAPRVCVVDSGILEGHPLLEPAIVSEKSRSFPAELGPAVPSAPVDRAGHGTQVAGLALYGDVARSAQAKAFVPQLRVVNARMLDDQNALHPDRMPFLREVVAHVKDTCRVFNLSFGLDPHDGFLSVHAAELDALAREFGVLFIVSSGNFDVGSMSTNNYPEFLLDPGYPVRSPAEALNVITVGGITPDSDPLRGSPDRRVVAPRRAPSPFCCSGGIKNVVKPELVEVAGNMVFDALINRWIGNDPGLQVLTTSPRFLAEGPLGFVHGSSFSAPKVSHLAGRLLERYPEATPNLLRALLVQSARLPSGVANWEKSKAMRLCGFGLPDLDRALFCRPQRATLFYEGDIVPDEVKLFDIPVPPDFAMAKGEKAITATVAFDPPVSVVHRDRPAGIHLTWRMARGDVSQSTVEAAIAEEAEREVADTATSFGHKTKKAFWTGTLPIRPQQRGTLQKNVFSWKRGVYGDTYRLAVTAKAIRPAHAKTRQPFALVVSLECADDAVNVFNLVRTRLGAGRIRIRVPSS